jgi:hypothetical protein
MTLTVQVIVNDRTSVYLIIPITVMRGLHFQHGYRLSFIVSCNVFRQRSLYQRIMFLHMFMTNFIRVGPTTKTSSQNIT